MDKYVRLLSLPCMISGVIPGDDDIILSESSIMPVTSSADAMDLRKRRVRSIGESNSSLMTAGQVYQKAEKMQKNECSNCGKLVVKDTRHQIYGDVCEAYKAAQEKVRRERDSINSFSSEF